MANTKIAITLDENTLERLDRLVKEHIFPSRSRAVQEAIRDRLERIEGGRLSRECAKLDPGFERAMAEEGITLESDEWPEY